MKLLFVSLGCDKNLVDSEHMMGDLLRAGYTICDDEAEAEVIVINSCCFIRDAMEESINTIIEMGEYKKTGCLKALIVTGCLAQRFTEDIIADLPEVDAIVGTNSFDEIKKAIDGALAKNMIAPDKADMSDIVANQAIVIKNDLKGLPKTHSRAMSTVGHSTYLKIAEGCDKRCTYCIIPYIRGSFRSVPINELVAEAKKLAAEGVKELNLVAQEITVYGTDLYGEKSLVRLLKELAAIDDIEWIRLLYAYPEEITDELIDYMAHEPKICHYIDIPIQHCSDVILKRMGRRTDKADIINVVSKLRAAMPDICLRTTLIAGFPGETKYEHAEVLEFVRKMRFDHLGCFAYSREEGTPAAKFENQVNERTKQKWVKEIMLLQQEISSSVNEGLIGRQTTCFIEGKLPEEGVYVGRTYRDAPSVDGFIFVNSPYDLHSGQMVQVTITGSDNYDLLGEVCDESAE